MKRVLIVGGLAAIAAACTIVNGLTVTSDPSLDAGIDSGDAGPSDPCAHAYPPSRPAPGGPEGAIIFVSALRTIDLGTPADGGTVDIGYDLDNTCTCPRAETCTPPRADIKQCDRDGGIDNTATNLFATAAALKIDLNDDFTNDLTSGAHGVIVWVSGYNGLADDPDVTVALMVAAGVVDGGKPTFKPGEKWNVIPEQSLVVAGGGIGPQSNVTVPGGYVANHQLVVRSTFSLPLVNDVRVDLGEAYLTAQIEQTDAGKFFLSKGVLSGRAPLSQLIRAIGGIERPTESGKRLCDNTPEQKIYFDALKEYVCNARDILRDPAGDNLGKACDALSLGLGFTAVATEIGAQKALDRLTYCADAALDCPTK